MLFDELVEPEPAIRTDPDAVPDCNDVGVGIVDEPFAVSDDDPIVEEVVDNPDFGMFGIPCEPSIADIIWVTLVIRAHVALRTLTGNRWALLADVLGNAPTRTVNTTDPYYDFVGRLGVPQEGDRAQSDEGDTLPWYV